MITFSRSTARSGLGILAILGLMLSLFAIATPAFADGDDSSAACIAAPVNVDAEDSGQSADEVTFTAGDWRGHHGRLHQVRERRFWTGQEAQ